MLTEFPPFQPKRFLRSGHAQTLGAFFLRGRRSPYQATKHVVQLDDGDRLVIHDDQPDSWITGDRIAILLHGLCGCHSAPYVVRCADKLQRQGIRTIRVDMRGFGDSTYLSRSHLHGGCWFDASAVVDYVHQMSPLSKLSLVGFSIGGNIILKMLGLWGEDHHPNVDSAVAVCPPIDLVHCAWNIRQLGNRIYENYFVKKMSKQLMMRRRKVADLVDNGVNPLPSRLIHFDDQFTAPCWGYRGAMDYYEDASSTTHLGNVAVRTIILTAQDDPVVPIKMFESTPLSSAIDVVAPRHGGHLGFLSRAHNDPDRHWMDWRICQWITGIESKSDPIGDNRPMSSSSLRGPHHSSHRDRVVTPNGRPR
ncbi:MAG: alpha/beta fold hydrolase [Planctomycetota bacterium]